MSSQLRHVSTVGKKLVKQQYVLHMSPQYGELRPTSGWDRSGSLRHPSKFRHVSRLGSITARHLVVGISQTLQRWTEGATYVRQGDHHVGHWPTFYFSIFCPRRGAKYYMYHLLSCSHKKICNWIFKQYSVTAQIYKSLNMKNANTDMQ